LIFYDGIYRLQRKEDAKVREGNAWRLRVINFALSQPEVKHLKPIALVATHISEGIFKTTCAESMGKRICRDLSLDVDHLLWIEHYPNEQPPMYVAVFTPKASFGPEQFHSVTWRPIRPNEFNAIRPFISEVDDMGPSR